MKKGKVNMMDDWGYYPSRIFMFSISYYVLNLLDLVITKVALATTEHVYELNPLFHHPLSLPLKLFAPVYLLSLYLFLYFINKSERDRRIIGKWGLSCVITLTIVYEFICINNLWQCLA
jgi:hypothetical protein